MAMKWYKPKDRKPTFGHKYSLIDAKGYWQPGYLKEIKTTEAGVEFVWGDESGEEIMNDITHYLTLEPPKNNQ